LCYENLKKYEKGLKDSEKSIEINKNWWKGYYRKSSILYELEKYEESHQQIKESQEKWRRENGEKENESIKKLKEKIEKKKNTLKRIFQEERKNEKGKKEYFSLLKKKKIEKNEEITPMTPTNPKFLDYYTIFYIPEILSHIFQYLGTIDQLK
jgi:tetratricopeptide (TPR) repeat protein